VGDRLQLSVGSDGIDLVEFRSVLELARAAGRGVVWFIDEIGILMPARFWQSFPVDLMFMSSQSRKFRVDIVWTAQDVEDVDSYLRRKTAWVWRTFAFPTSSVERQERGRRPWFFVSTRWRPGSVGTRDRRLDRSFEWYRRSWEGEFDTDELVAPPSRLVVRGRGWRT
jgi:hypothetical protein